MCHPRSSHNRIHIRSWSPAFRFGSHWWDLCHGYEDPRSWSPSILHFPGGCSVHVPFRSSLRHPGRSVQADDRLSPAFPQKTQEPPRKTPHPANGWRRWSGRNLLRRVPARFRGNPEFRCGRWAHSYKSKSPRQSRSGLGLSCIRNTQASISTSISCCDVATNCIKRTPLDWRTF